MSPSRIGKVNESSLHASLIQWYMQAGDTLEKSVEGYVIDIIRDGLLIEVQTGNFIKIKRKIMELIDNHQIRIVYPIARQKWILRIANNGLVLQRRKSPKRGKLEQVFNELVRFPNLAQNPNFSMDLIFVQEEDIWKDDGLGSWRRKGWSVYDRRLLTVEYNQLFYSPQDYLKLLPSSLKEEFTKRDLSDTLDISQRLAGRMVYCLKGMGVIQVTRKHKNANLYSIME